ncbi:ankyrin and HET domain-containing protein [Colletotrichum musicola]|uniref:Ankyrin and HET domain-containing protein n=1 Tax=Colletotrichum musicola TaxID=2175873 RepID=A0A8H6JG94_9PEZI|nr:ankyrin and HET domain-containing protein [Colletotrichum musicola]
MAGTTNAKHEVAEASGQPAASLYKPLTRAGREIRVISIHEDDNDTVSCSMKHVLLADRPEFDALSYTWGDPTITRPIVFNGHKVNVTQNLDAALHRLRSMKRQGKLKFIWIDALCINQTDLDEKSHQVPLMSEIYSSAGTVFAWLGPGSPSTGLCFEALREIRDIPKHQTPSEGDLRKLIRAYVLATSIALNPYWSRIWIVQELVLARRLIVVCGESAEDIENFLRSIVRAWDAVGDMDPRSETWKQEVEPLKSWLDPRHCGDDAVVFDVELWDGYQRVKSWAYLSLGHSRAEGLELVTALFLMINHAATNPLDKVYGLLGLVKNSSRQLVTIDYRIHPMEAFRNAFSVIWTCEDTLEILAEFDYSPSTDVKQKHEKDYPSWVPDLRRQHLGNSDWDVDGASIWTRGERATVSPDKKYITSHGILVDVVHLCGPTNVVYSHEQIHRVRQTILQAYETGTRPDHDFLRFIGAVHRIRQVAVDEPLEDDHPRAPVKHLRSIEPPWTFLSGGRDITVKMSPTSASSVERFPEAWSEIFLGTDEMPRQLMKNTDPAWREFVADSIYSFCHEANTFLENKAFAVTKAGFVGIAPSITKKGDMAVVLARFAQPMILRPHDEDDGRHYTIVGRSHLSGVMDFSKLQRFADAGMLGDKAFKIG